MLKFFTDTAATQNQWTLSYLRWLAAGDAERHQLYTVYRDYYSGKHPTKLSERMLEFLQLNTGINFDENFMRIPVDVLAERLKVIGFSCDNEEQEDVFKAWWEANRMDGMQDDVHATTDRDGDTYVIVGWDNELGRPSYSHELAFDGSNGVEVYYGDGNNDKIAAVKRWRVERGPGLLPQQRMNVYYPDRIEKYIIDSGAASTWRQYDEDGQWPIPWVDSMGKPLGIPVFHSANMRRGNDYGTSGLNDLIPIQDALNKTVIDTLAAADVQGFGMITLTGDTPPDDFIVSPGAIVYTGNPAAKFGHIPPGDISQLVGLCDNFVYRISQLSRTPLSYFQVTGHIASSDTQKSGEAGLLAKAEKAAVTFGNFWEDIMIFSRRLSNTFGSTSYDETLDVSCQWDSFERVDQAEEDAKNAQTLSTKANTFISLVNAGIDRRVAALRAGYTEEESDEMAAAGVRLLPRDQIAADVVFGQGGQGDATTR